MQIVNIRECVQALQLFQLAILSWCIACERNGVKCEIQNQRFLKSNEFYFYYRWSSFVKYEMNCGTEETISEMQWKWSELVREIGILLLLPALRCQLISTNLQHSTALPKWKSQLQPAFRAHSNTVVHCSYLNTAVHWSIMERWECTGRPVTTIHWLVSLKLSRSFVNNHHFQWIM